MTSVAPSLGPSLARGVGADVDITDVVREYPGHRALDGVSLRIAPGELVSLLGPSGCGKTTVLRAVAGFEPVDGGSISIDGRDQRGVPVNRRDIGMVFQSYSLFPHLSVRKNVEFGLSVRRIGAAERLSRATEALELVGLGAMADRYAHQLSGGQQQRVALARALVTRPRVLLLDEPLSALDAKVRTQLRTEIRRIQQELAMTTIFVTHDQEEALAISDRVAVMNAGRIEQVGPPESLYGRPATAFVAGFVGLASRVPGVARDGRVEVLGTSLPTSSPVADGPAVAFVRPEDLAFGADGVPGRVLATSFLGALRRTEVDLGGGIRVVVQHAPEEAAEAGDEVRVRFTGAPVHASSDPAVTR